MERPKLVWVPFHDYLGIRYPVFDSFLGPNHGVLFTIIIRENKRRGMELDHYLTLFIETTMRLTASLSIAPSKHVTD